LIRLRRKTFFRIQDAGCCFREKLVQEELLLIDRKNNVVTLSLNRPQKKNSLSPDLVNILLQSLEDLAADDRARAVVLRGSGDRAFCSGYDIRSLPTQISGNVQEKLKTLNPVETLFNAVVNFPFPVIAMINGVAFGAGCELAICCDIRIGAQNARMGMPPTKLGIVYPWKGLQRFIQTVGLKSTREMFFTGRTYQGPHLKELGLLDYLVPANEIESFVFQMAEEIANNAPLALRGTKRVINLLLQSNLIDESSTSEAEAITEAAFLSEDLKEGRLAFLEKRIPKFKGK
jgi:enoyl-CoA hydratase/carnithine racemase